MLEQLQPQSVFSFFEQICQIPHGSGNTGALSGFCARFAESRGLSWIRDEAGNVIIRKPAASGYETAAPVILQGHLDMVCEKEPGLDFCFETDPIRPRIRGDRVEASGTSLGGDDGIAVAMVLALLDSGEIPHPPLEAVFTTEEEVGMDGARALDLSLLKGRRLINLDSEDEGILTAGCAGGVRADCLLPLSREAAEGTALRVSVSGLQGGHSGVMIHKGLGNANVLMGRLLYGLSREVPVRLAELRGGEKDNAICRQTEAVVLADREDLARAGELLEEMAKGLTEEYRKVEPEMAIVIEQENWSGRAVSREDTRTAAALLCALPDGVQSFCREIPELVQTSLNRGVVRMEEARLRIVCSVRSGLAAEKEALVRRLEAMTALAGGTLELAGDYPAWEFRPESDLLTLVGRVFARQYGYAPKIETIHAGLECGVFAAGVPGMECVSLGPELRDVHTARESLSIPSVGRTWRLLLEILKEMKE